MFLSFEAIERYEQKQRDKESAEILEGSIKTPSAPIDVMKSKIASIKSKIESMKAKDDHIEYKKRNFLVWRKDPLM
jgi:hypothetical protein